MSERIRLGDYRVRGFPSLAELASELRANHRTINKAVNQLIDTGLLERLETGRVTVSPQSGPDSLHLALLMPEYTSPGFSFTQRVVHRLVTARKWQLKTVGYAHWRDTVIAESIRRFDGLFLLPPAEDVPFNILQLLKSAQKPVVVLEQDVSQAGIPSMRMASTSGVPSLLDLLHGKGHRRILCFNSQPLDATIRERIDQFRLWSSIHGVEGRLLEMHVEPTQSSIERAYTGFVEYLKQGQLDVTAIFCTTGAAALGVMRALAEAGLEPGRDVSVCAGDDEAGHAPYYRPSLTCLTDPQWDPYFNVCLDWFAGGGKEWVGPLCIHPMNMPVFEGKSTGPVSAQDRSMR